MTEPKRFYPNMEATHCVDRVLVALDACPDSKRSQFVSRFKKNLRELVWPKVRSAKARAKKTK